MNRTQIYLPEELLLESKLLSQNQNMNLSEFTREALRDYIVKQNRKGVTKNLSKFNKIRTFKTTKSIAKNSKPEEISKKIDEVVYGE
jgi:metal-responsive CopG/Arc/MetJ family transcriptional regulator